MLSVYPLCFFQDPHAEHQGHHQQHPLRNVPSPTPEWEQHSRGSCQRPGWTPPGRPRDVAASRARCRMGRFHFLRLWPLPPPPLHPRWTRGVGHRLEAEGLHVRGRCAAAWTFSVSLWPLYGWEWTEVWCLFILTRFQMLNLPIFLKFFFKPVEPDSPHWCQNRLNL